jgi:hypothetical protein
MSVIKIDIGAGGALALVSRGGELLDVADSPMLRDGLENRASVNAPHVAEIVAQW